MNSDSPKTAREEMEAWLTSLLLGELSEGEAAAVRELMKHDVELAKLHDRLKETISFVRETVPQMEAPLASEPLRLSEQRRKKLLARFVIPPLKERDLKPQRRFLLRLIEVLAVVALVGILVAMLLPSLGRAKFRVQRKSDLGLESPALFSLNPASDRTEAVTESQSAGGVPSSGSDNVNPANVVGYVNKVLPPQTTFGGAVALTPTTRATTAAESQPAAPAPSTSRSSLQIILPSVANSESAGANRGTEVAFGNSSSWGVSSSSRGYYADNRGVRQEDALSANSARDPEWSGILEKQPESHRPENAFLGRYAYVAPGNGPGLDISAHASNAKSTADFSQERLHEERRNSGNTLSDVNQGRAGLPVSDLFSADGTAMKQTAPANPEQTAFSRRYGLPAGQSAGGGIGGGGGARGGGSYAGGATTSPQPGARPPAAGEFGDWFAPSTITAAAPALQVSATPPTTANPEDVYLGTSGRTDVNRDQLTVLGDLPSVGKLFRSESSTPETAGRGFHLLGPEPQLEQTTKLQTHNVDAGVTAFGANTYAGETVVTAGSLALGQPPSNKGKASTDDVYLGAKLVPAGEPAASEAKVLNFGVADLVNAPATPPPAEVAFEEAVRQQPPTIALPSQKQEIAGVPIVEGEKVEVLARNGTVPARLLRASESEVAGKPAATPSPAQKEQQLLAESRLNDTDGERGKDRGRTSTDLSLEQLSAKKEKADVMAQVTDGRVLLEAGKLDDAEAKYRDAIKTDPQNATANYYLKLAKAPRVAAAERGLERDSKKGVTEIAQEPATPGFGGIVAHGDQSKSLDQAVVEQQKQVERLRKELSISDLEAMGNSPAPSIDADVVRRLQGELITAKTRLAREEVQLQEQELARLSPGQRPEAVALMTDRSNRVVTLRTTTERLKSELDSARETDIKNAEIGRPYYEAKQRLEELERFRTILNMKLAAEKIDVALPKSMMVEIIDNARPATAPHQTLWDRITGSDDKYQSTARIKIERDSSDIESMTKPNNVAAYDPYFIQAESEAIQSETVLGKVVDQLGLTEKWAKQRGKEKLKKEEAIALLKKRLDLKAVPNTSLIEIRVSSGDPNEASVLANKIAEIYHDHRLEKGRQLMQDGIKALKEQFDEQDKKVREARKEVDRLRAKLNAEKLQPPAVPVVEPDAPAIRKPSTNAPIPQPEIQTSENNFSTFSLNVSDVSFKLAAASLEKGQMPDAASVRSEEFINAFDYRDPEPLPGTPIAFAWERARYPFAHNRDLLRFSLKTAAAGRQAGRPLNIVLLLDNSGSMERADRVRIIREALRVLAEQLQPQDKLSVITFARTPRLWVDGASGDKAGEVAEQVSGIAPQGGTNLEEAMNLAYQTALRHYLAGGINRVVLLTDGAANLGDVEPDSLKQRVEAQRKQGIALDCFGIGWEGFNDDLLEVLSRNGDGRYGFINSPEEAATEFADQLAGALQVAASDVKVQVEFNPKRVTTYRQIGYAKHQLTKEQFRDNTVDAAEIAAQEAGNALYTVEPNPAGEGPLCTVRVRYKIPGTSDYREQAWDVPYTGNAVSLEQSSPAMRLAASASAFSEWLVASPFAAEVTPDRVLGYLGGVPEIYGADARPKKLEWMIRQAKSLQGK